MTDLTLPVRLDPDSDPDKTLHVTASGLPVRIYATDGGGIYPVHGAIYIDGQWNQHSWQADGAYDRLGAHDFDLRDRAPVKRGVWVAWFESEGGTRVAIARDTKEEAITTTRYKLDLRGVTYLGEGDGLDTPADPPLWVDWAELPNWAKWAAADEDGEVWVFDRKPEERLTSWLPGISHRCAEISSFRYRLAPGFDWRETLTQRPEGV